ncbi:MAG: LysE family transporter [Anaerolineae bacterium]|jgi:threonine/homoserine/homoserine lactone efflux protein|nr:LysE family transporter [Anaerolineae bacterium]
MSIALLFKGILIGFSIAAPVGPIGMLCMRRTLAKGRVTGIATGLGAATADAVYGCIGALGLTWVSGFLVDQQMWLRLIGGLFLCVLGVQTFLSNPTEETASAKGEGLLGAYASTFFLTLTNPMTILSFAAIFAGLGIGNTQGDYLAAMLVVLGVFIGSATWWLTLSGGVSLLRVKVTPEGLRWINRTSGIIIAGFGLFALLTLLGVH